MPSLGPLASLGYKAILAPACPDPIYRYALRLRVATCITRIIGPTLLLQQGKGSYRRTARCRYACRGSALWAPLTGGIKPCAAGLAILGIGYYLIFCLFFQSLVPGPPGDLPLADQSNLVTVKGKLGELKQQVDPKINVKVEGTNLVVSRNTNEKDDRSKHGLYRSLLSNMVKGVNEGYTIVQELVGVGYKAATKDGLLELALGYSHNIVFELPKEVTFETTAERGKNNTIKPSSPAFFRVDFIITSRFTNIEFAFYSCPAPAFSMENS